MPSPVPQCFWKTATASAAQAMWALSIMPITLNQNCNARPTSAGAVLCTVTKFSSHLDLGQLAGRQLRCPLCSPLLLEFLNDEQEAGSKSLETLKSLQNERLQRRAARAKLIACSCRLFRLSRFNRSKPYCFDRRLRICWAS